jgi:uncharacterized protein involved in exopolysaccharide biosynthesis
MTESREATSEKMSGRAGAAAAAEMFSVVWRMRKRIFIVSLLAGIATWGINYLFSDYYKATATLLPAPEKGRLSALGQFAEVAALAGVNVPGSETARLYPAIITSDTVLLRVLQRTYSVSGHDQPITLFEYLEIEEETTPKIQEVALKAMRSALSTSFDARTGIVSLGLILNDPSLAADVLNTTIIELDKFMRSKKTTNAFEQVRWIDVRLNQVGDSLRFAEESVKRFREKNRRVTDSPQLLMEQDRLVREVQVSSAVFIELKKQYELAKLEEIKNMTIVNVLDPARPPATKIGPKRKTNAAIAFILMLLGTSSFFALRHLYADRIQQFASLLRIPTAGTPRI